MQKTFVCRKCSTTNLLPIGYQPQDRDLLTCGWCRTSFVVHPCNHSHELSGLQSVIEAELLEVIADAVKGVVTKACPTCGVLYKVGDIVEKVDPQAGQAIKRFAIGAGLCVLAIAAIHSLSDRE